MSTSIRRSPQVCICVVSPSRQQSTRDCSALSVIFSQDDDFLRLHAAGVEHAGIAYSHPESRTIGQIIRGLVLIYECLTPDEMRGHVEFL